MAYLEMFPEEIIALQQELKNHPALLEKLKGKDLSESLAIIGADLGIVLDGMYTPLELAKLFLPRLKGKSILVLGSPEEKLVKVKLRETKNSVVLEKDSEKKIQ